MPIHPSKSWLLDYEDNVYKFSHSIKRRVSRLIERELNTRYGSIVIKLSSLNVHIMSDYRMPLAGYFTFNADVAIEAMIMGERFYYDVLNHNFNNTHGMQITSKTEMEQFVDLIVKTLTQEINDFVDFDMALGLYDHKKQENLCLVDILEVIRAQTILNSLGMDKAERLTNKINHVRSIIEREMLDAAIPQIEEETKPRRL